MRRVLRVVKRHTPAHIMVSGDACPAETEEISVYCAGTGLGETGARPSALLSLPRGAACSRPMVFDRE
jgi:hypothetical protein